MMIGKGSKAQEDAWAFMVFQATDEESSTGVYTLANDGLPADKRYWRSPEVLQRNSYPREIDVFIDPFEAGLVAGFATPAYAHPLWPNLAWTEWHQAIKAAFDEFTNNRTTVAEGVKRAQKDSQEVLDRAYQQVGG